MAVICHGNGPDHCCYTPEGPEGVCPFLEFDTMPGRHFVCGLRRRLGSWDAVYADPGYQRIWGDFRCGDFGPVERQCCYAETS